VFARLGPRHPPNHKKVHALKRKTSKRDKTKTSKKTLDHDIEEYMAKDVRTLDRALDDYMKEGERSKKKKLDQELSQYVAERKTDGSN
jgi:hypothetical protein